jgi:hypothetical protein
MNPRNRTLVDTCIRTEQQNRWAIIRWVWVLASRRLDRTRYFAYFSEIENVNIFWATLKFKLSFLCFYISLLMSVIKNNTCQIGDHCLEVEQALQPALSNLWLIGGVGSGPEVAIWFS